MEGSEGAWKGVWVSFGGVASAGCLTIQVAPHGLIRVAHLQEVAAAGWLMHNFEVLRKAFNGPTQSDPGPT